jgi:hypothetical protein
MNRYPALILAFWLAGTGPLLAQAETAKLVTEDALPVDPGVLEVEFGYQIGEAGRIFDEHGQSANRERLAGHLLALKATRGIKEGLDAAVELSWRNVLEDEEEALADSLGNVAVTAKWRVFSSTSGRAALSWVPGITAPLSDSSRSTERVAPGQVYWSADNLLAFTFAGNVFNLSADAGYFLAVGGERGDQRGELVADAAVGFQITGWLQPVVELNFSEAYAKNAEDSTSLRATWGVVLSLPRATRLDLGLQKVIDGKNADRVTALLANFSVSF